MLDKDTFAELRERGLVGIEVDHQDHDDHDRDDLRRIAEELDLVITGASDYHGTGKVDHDLGCNVTSPAEYDRLLARAGDNAARARRPVAEVIR